MPFFVSAIPRSRSAPCAKSRVAPLFKSSAASNVSCFSSNPNPIDRNSCPYNHRSPYCINDRAIIAQFCGVYSSAFTAPSVCPRCSPSFRRPCGRPPSYLVPALAIDQHEPADDLSVGKNGNHDFGSVGFRAVVADHRASSSQPRRKIQDHRLPVFAEFARHPPLSGFSDIIALTRARRRSHNRVAIADQRDVSKRPIAANRCNPSQWQKSRRSGEYFFKTTSPS